MLSEPTTREILEVAARTCTDRQLEALVAFEDGYSVGSIARRLGITREAVRARIDLGLLKIERELAAR